MAGGQGSGGRGNRPFTGGLGNAMGGGPAYGQQQHTGPQMPSQATYQQNAPNPGGFAPAAPGAQMMQAGQATPYQMNYGSQARQPLPMNGGQNYRQQFNQYMQQWQRNHPGGGGTNPAPTPTTPPSNAPPATDPATGNPVDPVTGLPVDPAIGIATDVYGHYQGEGGAGGGAGAGGGYSADFDPRTAGMPGGNRRPQLQALHERLKARNMALQDSGEGVRGSADPRYTGIQSRLQGLYPKQQQYRNQRADARNANMQTLLAAQTAGTTLTPEQLDWLTKMQARNA